jgi:hypothetical protein
MAQYCTWCCINIGPRVANVLFIKKDFRDYRIKVFAKLDQRILGPDMLVCKLYQTNESRICLPQNCMTVAWNYSVLWKGPLHILLNVWVVIKLPILLLELKQVLEAVFTCKTVQRPGQSIEPSWYRQVWVWQGASNKMWSMRADVSTFMISISSWMWVKLTHEAPNTFSSSHRILCSQTPSSERS